MYLIFMYGFTFQDFFFNRSLATFKWKGRYNGNQKANYMQWSKAAYSTEGKEMAKAE